MIIIKLIFDLQMLFPYKSAVIAKLNTLFANKKRTEINPKSVFVFFHLRKRSDEAEAKKHFQEEGTEDQRKKKRKKNTQILSKAKRRGIKTKPHSHSQK